MKLDITKGKIKEAAIQLMKECSSPSEVTSRKIAKKAGVQLAMINYCFGSREALLFSVFNEMTAYILENDPDFAAIIKSGISPKEKLKHLHYNIIVFLLDEFTFTKAITGYVLLNRDLTKALNSLPFVMEHYSGRRSLQECKLISYELSSMLQLAVYRHDELKELCGIDLKDREQLKRFVDMQVDLFLTDQK
jgi:AcrR family transcriptional regulator